MPKKTNEKQTRDSLVISVYEEKVLRDYLEKKGANHRNYKTYSSQRFIEEVINEQRIYLSDGSNWNDVADRKGFNSDNSEYKNFGKCFSFSDSESVAMWMLYGGIDNCGAMINFTQKDMKKIISIDNIILGRFVDGTFVEHQKLDKSKFIIRLIDVLYVRKEEDGFYTRRSTETCHNVDSKVIENLGGMCVKDTAWCYENECRLVVSVNKKFIKEESVIKLDISAFNLSESYNKVYHSPTYKGDRMYLSSELQGYVDWNLCSNCDARK